MVLFVGELPLEVEYTVWDMFLAKGSVVLFRVALTILQFMQEELEKDDELESVMMVISTFCKTKVTRELLLKNLVPSSMTDEIRSLREIYRKQVIANLQSEMN